MKLHRKAGMIALALAGLMVAVAACGGGSGEDPDTGTDATEDTAGDTGVDATEDTAGDTGVDTFMDMDDDGCPGEGCPSDGDLRCSGSIIERCSAVGDGCLAWTEHLDCGSAGGECNVSGTDCHFSCTPMEDGLFMCFGDLVLVCDSTSYLVTVDCSVSGETCQVIAPGVAICG